MSKQDEVERLAEEIRDTLSLSDLELAAVTQMSDAGQMLPPDTVHRMAIELAWSRAELWLLRVARGQVTSHIHEGMTHGLDVFVAGQTPTISAQQFQLEGYLQELNRQFLHPLGLAMAISFDMGNPSLDAILGPIYDARNDPDGIRFDDSVIDGQITRARAGQITSRQWDFAAKRKMLLGYVIQPIKGILDLWG